MKMEKTPRYTQRERNMVLGFAAQYKDVIENKRTDAESNRKKDEVWRQIAKEFNCRVYHQRSSKQLRQLYKNMKLLLKKDLCGDGKSNRSFMDILNALAQQDSVAQYISEQMSPSGYSSSRQQKYDDDFDDSKLPSVGYDGMDNDVIVIKSEDISDNEQASQNGVEDMDDDDDDDCLSTKDIPEVCLEEEDDEIFATDLRRNSNPNPQLQAGGSLQSPQQQQLSSSSQPEITIQNVGGIRVGSIGNIASLTNPKSLLNGINNNNSSSSNNNNNNNNNSSSNNNSALSINLPTSNSRSQISAEQQQQRDQQQQLLFSGLGLSAVNTDQSQQQLPTLQHASQRPTSNNHNNNNNNHHHHHHNNSNAINSNGLLTTINSNYQSNKIGGGSSSSTHNNNNSPYGLLNRNSSGNSSSNNNRNNDYLLSLAIEERKRKIELLNAQIDYWKTLTKKLDANSGHNPTPSCLCHFPAKVNGLQSQQSSS